MVHLSLEVFIFVLLAWLRTVSPTESGYFVVAPKVLRPGVKEKISVTLFNVKEPVTVKASLVLHGESIAFAEEDILEKGTLTLEVPNTKGGKAWLKIGGNWLGASDNGFTIDDAASVTIQEKGTSILVQTDKPVYKPGQNVLIHVITMKPDLRPQAVEEMHVYINDPRGTRMIQWINPPPLCCGMVNLTFPISDQPILGEWNVVIESQGGMTTKKSFSIQKYVLPKIDVIVEPPPFVTGLENCVPITVTARYTFGELVRGKLSVITKLTDSSGVPIGKPSSTHMQIYGKDTFQLCLKDLDTKSIENKQQFRGFLLINATVIGTDGSSHSVLHDSTPVHRQMVQIKFSENFRENFKPGLSYRGKIMAFFPDGSPSDDVTVQIGLTGGSIPIYTTKVSSENGVAVFELPPFDIPVTRMWLEAKIVAIRGESVEEGEYLPHYKGLGNWYSPTECYITAYTTSSEKLKVGEKAEVKVESTCPCDFDLHYEVTSRGNIVTSGVTDAGRKRSKRDLYSLKKLQLVNDTIERDPVEPYSQLETCSFTFPIDITYEMVPSSRLLVFYVKEDQEGVADSIKLEVQPELENKVTLKTKTSEVFPGERLNMTVETKPGSCVCVAAVDKSVHLLGSNFHLYKEEVFEELKNYDISYGIEQSAWKQESFANIYLSTYTKDSEDALMETGLVNMTDSVRLRQRQEHIAISNPDGNGGVASMLGATGYGAEQLKLSSKRRTYFPETWIWKCFNMSSTRKQESFQVKIPDTITTWVADTISLSKHQGLGIADPITIRTFKSFFVQFTMPYSAIRGEQLKLPLTIFNYYQECLEAHLIIHVPNGVRFPTYSQTRMTKKICIGPGETRQIPLLLLFKELGYHKLSVQAEAFRSVDCCEFKDDGNNVELVAIDRLSRKIFVEAEGIPRSYTHNLFFCPNERMHISTPNIYSYQMMEKPRDSIDFSFLVKTEYDAHILLSPIQSDPMNAYEIVIGGDRNFKSWISRSQQGESLVKKTTPNILSMDEYRSFWISWDNGIIEVGYGEERSNMTVFLQYYDPDPLEINYIGFSTGWGSMGQFKIWKKEFEEVAEIIQLNIPLNAVRGSARGVLSVIGDVMGPTLTNLENLLQLPFGCGEQNMIHFAPNVYVLRYLKRTHQLTPQIEEQIKFYLIKGYQRQLTYRRKDGSYSAFGSRDASGSMWLTAFVLKSFGQSRSFIYIDPNELKQSIEWIKQYQKKDGSYSPVGRVINKDIQGGLQGSVSLTAYVIVALFEVGVSMESNTVQSAKEFLENNLRKVHDPYTAALTAYALTKLKSEKYANEAINRLNQMAIRRDGMTYWAFQGIEEEVEVELLNQDVYSAEVEMTAYALLTYTAMEDVGSAMPVVRWLTQQRNAMGGFKSTQDTCVALQALSEYAILSYSGNVNLTIQVNTIATPVEKSFHIDQHNSKVLQTLEIPFKSLPKEIIFLAVEGEGCGLIQADVNYNIPSPSSKQAFQLRVKMKEEKRQRSKRSPIDPSVPEEIILGHNDYRIVLEVCTRWTHAGSSNMAVIEATLLTGFVADINTLEQLLAEEQSLVKRYEVDGRKVLFYLDEVPSVCLTCVKFEAYREYMVGKTQFVPVRVYDYYEPTYEATRFYNVTGNSLLAQELCENEFCNEVTGNSYNSIEEAIEIPQCNFVGNCITMDQYELCRSSCVRNCPFGGEEVCGSDGVFYQSECHMEEAACRQNLKNLTLAPIKECEEKEKMIEPQVYEPPTDYDSSGDYFDSYFSLLNPNVQDEYNNWPQFPTEEYPFQIPIFNVPEIPIEPVEMTNKPSSGEKAETTETTPIFEISEPKLKTTEEVKEEQKYGHDLLTIDNPPLKTESVLTSENSKQSATFSTTVQTKRITTETEPFTTEIYTSQDITTKGEHIATRIESTTYEPTTEDDKMTPTHREQQEGINNVSEINSNKENKDDINGDISLEENIYHEHSNRTNQGQHSNHHHRHHNKEEHHLANHNMQHHSSSNQTHHHHKKDHSEVETAEEENHQRKEEDQPQNGTKEKESKEDDNEEKIPNGTKIQAAKESPEVHRKPIQQQKPTEPPIVVDMPLEHGMEYNQREFVIPRVQLAVKEQEAVLEKKSEEIYGTETSNQGEFVIPHVRLAVKEQEAVLEKSEEIYGTKTSGLMEEEKAGMEVSDPSQTVPTLIEELERKFDPTEGSNTVSQKENQYRLDDTTQKTNDDKTVN